MPITKSAKKALRQSNRRQKVNKNRKNELKQAIKSLKKLADVKNKETKNQLSLVYKKLDKAAKINLIKKNKSNRLKSRLSAYVNKKTA